MPLPPAELMATLASISDKVEDMNLIVPTPEQLAAVKYNSDGLVPVIAQDIANGDVLMMAWLNAASLSMTFAEGRMVYYSRSRQKLWRKGEESGNVQELHAIYFDCDGDTLLVKVNQIGGAACHEGFRSCFFRRIDPQTQQFAVEGERVFDPKAVYGK